MNAATCVCAECGYDYEFELPVALTRAASRGDLVVFAGAGISTENSSVMSSTFYGECLAGLSEPPVDDSFPQVMSAFEREYGRRELVKRLKKRIDYIDSFPTLRWSATKFHRTMSTMPYLSDIITTNWDTYFEDECAATPIVHGEDFAFSDLVGRKVYKIHGSMTSLASLVATQEDYEQRLDDLRNNALGGQLRTFLATKTVVFIGYSLRDWNFRALYDALLTDMGAFRPRAYVVSPFESVEAQELGLRHFRTSGVEFLRSLKASLLGHCNLADHIYPKVSDALDEVLEANARTSEISHKDHPTIAHCLAYQDGLIHAWGRVNSRRKSGEYSDRHHVVNLVRSYAIITERNLSSSRFFDAAYASGYGNAMMYLLLADDPDAMLSEELEADQEDEEEKEANSEPGVDAALSGSGQTAGSEIDEVAQEDHAEDELPLPPFYLAFGGDGEVLLDTLDALRDKLASAERDDPAAYAEAVRLVDDLPAEMVVNHTPFVQGVEGTED